ncbi:MAG: hypothetical protein JWN81_909 [Solirubrobacterales bacterium]|nr:hypothetical protein [Solirubrobacterales bacterium]
MSSSVARFEVVAGNAVGMSILVEDELVIGRHAEGAGRLAEDDEISRMHARVTLDESGFCAIEDLGSTNGTFVNGLRMSGPQTLSEGDMIELGATTLTVSELRIANLDQPPDARQSTSVPRAPEPSSGPPSDPGQATPAVERTRDTPDEDAASHEPTADTEATLPAPTLSLRLEVDFAAREARLVLNDSSEPVRLVLEGDVWRAAGSAPTDEHRPQ